MTIFLSSEQVCLFVCLIFAITKEGNEIDLLVVLRIRFKDLK